MMKVKICGIKYRENFDELVKLDPDYVGFIFYEKSLRNAASSIQPKDLLHSTINKVGVFVDAELGFIQKQIQDYQLEALQFHGNETPDFCNYFQASGIAVIKAFSVDDQFDFFKTTSYKNYCNYFLFDTKGEKKGGNGNSFNWQKLQEYDQKIPFFLSGGIGLDNVQEALQLTDLNMYGMDINSRIEDEPGLKNIEKAKEIITTIKNFKI